MACKPNIAAEKRRLPFLPLAINPPERQPSRLLKPVNAARPPFRKRWRFRRRLRRWTPRSAMAPCLRPINAGSCACRGPLRTLVRTRKDRPSSPPTSSSATSSKTIVSEARFQKDGVPKVRGGLSDERDVRSFMAVSALFSLAPIGFLLAFQLLDNLFQIVGPSATVVTVRAQASPFHCYARCVSGRHTVNSLPLPRPALRADTVQPCISTNVFTSDRPIPKPAWARSTEVSTCANNSKIRDS